MENVGTPAEALAKLNEVITAIRDDAGEKDKLKKALAETTAAVQKFEADSKDRMRFDSGATKELVRYGLNTAMRMPTSDERLKALQVYSDDIHITDALMRKVDGYQGWKSLKLAAGYNRLMGDFAKTMNTGDAGEGLEWVPLASLSGELMYAIELAGQVTPRFPSFTMWQDVVNYPIRTSTGDAYRMVEVTDGATNTKVLRTRPGTGRIAFDAELLMARVIITKQLSEDAIVAILPEMKTALVTAHAKAKENAVIQGQSSGAIDTSTADAAALALATDQRNLWDGVRKYCQTNSAQKVDLATFNANTVHGLRKKLGATGVDPTRCLWIASPSVYYNLMVLKDDAGVNVMMRPYEPGQSGTLATGLLGRIFGIPVVPSVYVREDLNATGISDNVTATKAILPIVHLDSWKFGTYKEITVAVSDELYMESDCNVVVTRERLDFQAMFPYATQRAAALGYNITP